LTTSPIKQGAVMAVIVW